MKKTIVAFAIAFSLFSCNKEEQVKTATEKTAYVNTVELMEKYTESKDLQAKYKQKGETMGRELDQQVKRFQEEAQNFQRNAQANGPEWAQRKGAELQKREQELTYAQQSMMRQLQDESGVEMDSMKSRMKKFIQDYGKKNGYTYIYGTGEASTILYGKDGLDITDKILKELNDKYKAPAKEEEKAPATTEAEKK
ncbi:OmpH family outer membrane protein [Flavobacterium sp. NST-5]|uniref:OmpH family outer membrane protein n=1 Tax=Flavobacterium ichthyis TaxID=2698827 RepID=A0ABW9ZDD2_9FLAO|nr:OmpH family outer membrane protein [Flavobacterium ichthyis]NBL65749.1 OmpH family outer membrane protein [Flavobacterium ichthyis]